VESANLFVEQARQAGITVQLTKADANSFYGERYLSWNFAQDFWNTRNYIPQAVVGTFPPEQGGTYNETHWDHPQFTELINQARREPDAAKRTTLLHDAQEIEYNEGGLIIWGFRQQVDAYGASVQGLEPSKYLPLGSYKFNKVSVS